MIDVNFIRESEIALHGLNKLDEVYTIYYDETNNIRRLHIRTDGLNVRDPKCFVIGGIAHHGAARELDIHGLRKALRIQKTASEIKLKHVATGDFADLLAAAKLEVFFRWLIDAGLFVHYFALDPLYWSVVDVIDSILAEYGNDTVLMANWELKNDLYAVLRSDRAGTVDLFQRYSYPDVGREHRRAFVAELVEIVDCRRTILPHFNHMMLKGVLEIGKNLSSLPYLEDETPNVLIDGFGMFFVHRICLFKNCEHILDVEAVIQSYVSGQTFTDGEQILANFRFAVSDDEPGIQISDVITGVLGKRHAPPAMRRKRVRRRSLWPAIESSPQASACLRPEFEVAIEGKFDGVGSGDDRRFFQPNAVLDAVQMQHGVPTVGTLP